jgi:cytosine permease
MQDSKSSAIQSLDKLYEFEHEPVSEDKLQPGKHFAGLLAGEHVAGTEFVIGAMFVAWGVRAVDIFLGLLIGNTLAVLTWTLICTPIAVRTRLTLYWYLRKIAGPVTTTVYNILNAILFCILAGCMITVSASAVRIPLDIPAQVNWYPTDIRFVLLVLVVGAGVVALAILGFKKLAQFASVCSPWLFLMFLGGAVATLPSLAQAAGLERIASWSDFWVIANKVIWIGTTPDGGKASISFWHVTAFAWICNLAMHGGLSDMALFRYAKKASYGFYSAFGMFFGHYLAWIFAGVMGAAAATILKTTIDKLDAGGVASQALGVSGIIAVVLAGWTTSNPTLYRAGLAFQAVIPNWPRWFVTLVVGAATTGVACFPFVFTKLLNFVGWYGLLLMPVGAIVFAEHWLFPRLGLTQYWASRKNLLVNWPALISWAIAIAASFILEHYQIIHLFFLFLPVWLLTIVLYIILASMAGARGIPAGQDDIIKPKTPARAAVKVQSCKATEGQKAMFWLAGAVAAASLIGCIAMPVWVFLSDAASYTDNLEYFRKWLIVPTLVYFVSGTYWYSCTQKGK